ncbi:helix-turn-helix domain-containing protein [Streptomyces coeruleorubidus]|uniref:helix-turn-helix domain-containing protein n=1 Tax=Streptomyces coeruleorubidus TaxID=116188 RepID=UPI001FCB54D4|nr:helix-turn-helix domain-containing protein [Streptomyces coeruleorubidus]
MSQRPDLRQRRAVLEHEWSRWVPRLSVAGARPGGSAALRHEVTESWARSLSSVDPGRDSAPVTDGGPVHERWTSSPLYRPVSGLAGELRSIAEDAGFVTAVTDESGTILWTCGGPTMRRHAERVNFAPGGRWDEQAMGTNALSLALRTGRPSSVFSAEHLVSALHGWVCYCAPVHGPDGRVLGVLDLSTTWDRSHPLAMSTVRTLVSTIEARLTTEVARPSRLRLTCLGSEQVAREGRPLPLRPRQLEILTLLALEPGGFSPERLRAALYGDRPVTSSTFKAEISHLRRALGGAISPATTPSPPPSPATPPTSCARWSRATRTPPCSATAARSCPAPRHPASRSGAAASKWPYGRPYWRVPARKTPCATANGPRTTRRSTSTRCGCSARRTRAVRSRRAG